MSDTQQTPDWWLASDGKWYPPQGSGQPLAPPPQESRSQAKLRKGQAKLHRDLQPFLEPGEQLQAAFISETGPGPGHIGLAANLQRYWMVGVTDRNILLCPFGRRGSATRLPRTVIEMPDAPSHSSSFPVTIDETRHWVAREQYNIVFAANEYLRATQAAPAGGEATESTVGTPTQQATAEQAAWYTDPTRRHELRYWDGQSWGASVSDQGAQSTDPI